MKIDKFKVRKLFKAEDGETLEVSYSNRTDGGYHEGVEMHFQDDDGGKSIGLFFDSRECKELRDTLLKLYPVTDKQFTK